MDRLLEGLRRGDVAALELLHALYSERLVRAAWTFTGNWEVARDATQECLIAAMGGAGHIREANQLRAWLFGVLFNCCRTLMRKESRRRRREERKARALGERASGAQAYPEETLALKLRLHALQQALAGLDEGKRMVIVLRFLEGMSVKDCAQVLGIPEGSVKSRTHSALGELKETLKDWRDDTL